MATLLEKLEAELNKQTVEEIEDAGKYTVPDGYYHACLDSQGDDDESSKGNRFIPLDFTLLGGPKTGKKITVELYTSGKDPALMLRQLNRYRLRCGLVSKAADGKTLVPVAGKKTFNDCVGAEVILHVTVRKWENKEKGTSGEENEVAMFGIYAIGDPELKNKTVFMAGEAAVKQAAEKRKQDDISDIPV